VDVLVSKTLRAAWQKKVSVVSVTGGVSANRRLREVFRDTCQRKGIDVFFPKLSLCTDNAAMVAACGYYHFQNQQVSDYDLDVVPSLSLG